MTKYSLYLFTTLLFLVLIVYILGFLQAPQDFTIIQTSLANFNIDLLLEKNPIVIPDITVDCIQLTNTVFSYMYVYKTSTPFIKHKNQYKYLLIRCIENCEILIQHPKKNTSTIIKLYFGNILILPWGWKYSIKKYVKNVQIIGLHTISSIVASFIFS